MYKTHHPTNIITIFLRFLLCLTKTFNKVSIFRAMKVDILAFGAHPDDVELSCSGTLLKQIQLGRKVGIIDLTRGELGTRGNAETRQKEAERAAKMMGLAWRENVNLRDGFLQVDESSLLKIIHVIRSLRPEIVLCNAPTDRHPDHGIGAQLVVRAAFLAGLEKIQTEQEKWRPKTIFHYIQDNYLEPSFLVDITEYMPQKMDLVQVYSSQFYNDSSSEPETPISRKDFLPFIVARARNMGRMIGTEFAEGFIAQRPIGTNDIFNLI